MGKLEEKEPWREEGLVNLRNGYLWDMDTKRMKGVKDNSKDGHNDEGCSGGLRHGHKADKDIGPKPDQGNHNQ